ncbi:MAG: peptide-methionine (S)-S-oxide reductase MsrA [Pseudomonadota bacterium]
MALFSKKTAIPAHDEALPGRNTPLPLSGRHFVNGTNIKQPAAGGLEEVLFGLGCFWGAERKFWQIPGVVTTAVGYAGGHTPNATYDEVCSGRTGHTEVVRVLFDPNKVGFDALLKAFWESHDPTQGMRQGGDVGTQYRSAIYTSTAAQQKEAEASKRAYQAALTQAHRGSITTEVKEAPALYYAEEYHQQYLAKNPRGYCGLNGCGVTYEMGTLPIS